MIRTDLAIENREIYKEAKKLDDEIPGINVEQKEKDNIKITVVKIETEDGAKALNKPIGNYITLDIPEYNSLTYFDEDNISKNISVQLKRLIPSNTKTVLIVGLGNKNITADSLGPNVISHLDITRHILEFAPEEINSNTKAICAISPGVLGTTGIETSEIIKGIVDKIKPDIVIGIDSLAARRIERINSTIQISDTGIHPGSGVGNRRKGLTKDNLNVPVIAIGIPTVVDAQTITNDIINKLFNNSIEEEEKEKFVNNITKDNNYIVTPKDIDDIVYSLSNVLAEGINTALLN